MFLLYLGTMIIFTIVFVFVLNKIVEDVYRKLNDSQLKTYLRDTQFNYDDGFPPGKHKYNGVIAFYIVQEEKGDGFSYLRKDQPIYDGGNDSILAEAKDYFLDKIFDISKAITTNDNLKIIKERKKVNYDTLIGNNKIAIEEHNKKNYLRQIEIQYDDESPTELLVWSAFTDNSYEKEEKTKTMYKFNILLFGLFTASNLIMFFWMHFGIVRRLQKLTYDIQAFPKHNYQRPVRITGNDEITTLLRSTDDLRSEISINEIRKREILQNISHDIKNPIGIVLSYAIAIKDGVADISDINKIIQHSEVLQKRIRQLIEFVKAEYMSRDKAEFTNIHVKKVIEELVNDNKFRFEGSFITSLDNSKYYGNTEKFSIAIQNILENSIRHAKSKIEITLSKKRLTISNDGPKFLDGEENLIFNLYQKSTKGQFGIGLSITKATLVNMNLDIVAKNTEEGVIFIIAPT